MVSQLHVFLLFVFFFLRLAVSPQPQPLMDVFPDRVRLSYAAYCLPDTLSDWSCYYCSVPLTSVYTTGETPKHNLAYVGLRKIPESSKYDVVVAFRGSQSPISRGVSGIVNWLYDADFYFSKWPYIRKPNSNSNSNSDMKPLPDQPMVHHGFLVCLDDVWESLNPHLESLVEAHADEIESLTIVGHSLGAAIGALYGLRLIADTSSVKITELFASQQVYFYLFGCPRFGNADLFALYESEFPKENYFRVVNQKDLVTGVPPTMVGYHHEAIEYWFENSTKVFRRCDGSGEDPKCGDSVWRDSAADHLSYLGIEEGKGHCQ